MFTHSFDPDQALQNVGSDLHPQYLIEGKRHISLSQLFIRGRVSADILHEQFGPGPDLLVVPITQLTHMRNKNNNIQGRSHNVIK